MLIPELTFPEDSVRVCAVDPGSAHLGLAVLDWRWGTDLATVVWAKTVHVSDETHNNTLADNAGKRHRRMEILKKEFETFLIIASPTYVITETPFFSRRTPSAFESGVELQYILRSVMWEVYPSKVLHGIDPMAVKRYVGVTPKGTDKTHMSKAVIELYKNSTLIDLTKADEHSIDAIAVGNYFIRSSILNLNQLLPVSNKPFNGKRKFRLRRRRKK